MVLYFVVDRLVFKLSVEMMYKTICCLYVVIRNIKYLLFSVILKF